MNNKQIACVVLSMVIGLMAYGTLTMKKKLAAASEESEQAANKASAAENGRKTAQQELDKKDRETVGLRDYLAEWQPYLKQTTNDTSAEGMFDQKLNQGDLVILRQSFEPMKLDPASTIPHGLRARLIFENDYHMLLNWLGSLESTLPTCRVSSCRISKGTKGNDVKMELSAEVPMAVATNK
jgi:hypothetical protein